MKCFDSIQNRSHAGFTLIEMSIVIVIIALIVGGILTGQSMVRSSELRSVIKDVEAYRTAVATFNGKYNGLPGDMPNATMFFSNCNTGSGLTSCNGNGNGIIEYNNSASNHENYGVWQLLSLAGLVNGGYGTIYSGGWLNPTTGAPRCKFTNSCIYWICAALGWGQSSNVNDIRLGNFNPLQGAAWGGVITSTDAQWIDDKMDDGMPHTGSVITQSGYQSDAVTVYPASNCVSGAGTTATYASGVNIQGCVMTFTLGL